MKNFPFKFLEIKNNVSIQETKPVHFSNHISTLLFTIYTNQVSFMSFNITRKTFLCTCQGNEAFIKSTKTFCTSNKTNTLFRFQYPRFL